MWGHGEYLAVTDKTKDQEKKLGPLPACLHPGWPAPPPHGSGGDNSTDIKPQFPVPLFRLPMLDRRLVILQEPSRPLAQTGIAKEPSHMD